MAEARVERRLAAILAADVAGYARLTGMDEEGTHLQLKEHLRALVDPKISEHRGHVVKNTGDGMLAEFNSVVDAVRCAIDVQRGMAERNVGLPQERRIEFRIGINVGDVIIDGGDIFGDGVNVAVRLEGIAEPGGICVSAPVREEYLRGQFAFPFEDVGEQWFKNIDRPVRAYAIQVGALAADSDPSEKVLDKPASGGLLSHLRGHLKFVAGALASVAAVGAIAGGLVGYWNVWKTVRTDLFREAQKTQREAAARPDIAPRLSLVVLPFANLNNDPEQDFFADAITTDLTTDLAQRPGSFVIGRGTAFTYKNKPVDLKTLGKDLGIRWAVQGAVRRNGDQVRVNVSLTDLSTGRDIWSDRFDGDRTNLPVLQDQITVRLARSLNLELNQAESRRSEADRSRNPDSMDFSMRGWAKLGEGLSKTQNAQAKDLFDNALRLDPDNVSAMIGKAGCLANKVNSAWSESVIEDKKQATDLIDKALSKNPGRAMAHVVKGAILLYGQPEEALAEYEAALEINPNLRDAHTGKAVALILSGRAREAIYPVQLALRISPRDPLAFFWHWEFCNVHLHLHEYKEAIEECRRSIILNNSSPRAYISLISAYGLTGQMDQARQALSELDKRDLKFTLQVYRHNAYAFSSDPQYRRGVDNILDGLRKAGVPEQ